MLNQGNIVKLVVICTTVILLVWLTRSKLCELRIRSGNTEVAAILAYESERYGNPTAGACSRPLVVGV
jgi:protein HokC/D